MTYTEQDMYKVMRDQVTVFEVRDPVETQIRYNKQDKQIKMLVSEIMKGPIQGGTRASLPIDNMFGSGEWQALKRGIMLRDPICRICGERPTKEVHHIRPRYLNGKDHPRNLIGLCLECHDEVHRRIEEGIEEALRNSIGAEAIGKQKVNVASLDDYDGKKE